MRQQFVLFFLDSVSAVFSFFFRALCSLYTIVFLQILHLYTDGSAVGAFRLHGLYFCNVHIVPGCLCFQGAGSNCACVFRRASSGDIQCEFYGTFGGR